MVSLSIMKERKRENEIHVRMEESSHLESAANTNSAGNDHDHNEKIGREKRGKYK